MVFHGTRRGQQRFNPLLPPWSLSLEFDASQKATGEKNVVSIGKFSRFVATCCWTNLIVRTPKRERKY